MATMSPALSNNSTDTPTTSATTPTTSKIVTLTPTSITSTTSKANSPSKAALTFQRDAPRSLRGLNKPKCSVCGNVARSRCPYLSCKSCCAKAENPCPIHVLKQTGPAPEKKPHLPSLFDQKSSDASPSGSSLRVSSLRQLNQFNGTQTPPRVRRQLTRKEAAALNQWRFSKVKEYKERNIEVENEAFDRYMQNVSLLEEAFSLTSPDGPGSVSDDLMGPDLMVSGFKAGLRSNPRRGDNLRKRIKHIVDEGLSKLRKLDSNDYKICSDLKRTERALVLDELIEKLNKARNEEELVTCSNIQTQLFNPLEKGDAETLKEHSSEDAPAAPKLELDYVLPRLWSRVEIDQDTLDAIDVHFSSLDQIEDL